MSKERESIFGFNKPEESPGFLLWQTTVSWQRRIKEGLAEYGVSHSQFVILALLRWFERTGGDSTQAAVVRESRLDKMTVSKALKQLVKMELLERWEDERDTRVKVIKLKGRGQELISKLVPVVEGIDADFFKVLGEDEKAEFVGLLRQMASCSIG